MQLQNSINSSEISLEPVNYMINSWKVLNLVNYIFAIDPIPNPCQFKIYSSEISKKYSVLHSQDIVNHMYITGHGLESLKLTPKPVHIYLYIYAWMHVIL